MAVSTLVGTQYQQMLQAVANYYGEGSDVWYKVATQQVTPKELASILKQTPNVNTVVNLKGEIISYEVLQPVNHNVASSNIGSISDSNLVPATNSSNSLTTLKIPAQTGEIVEGSFTEVPLSSGAKKYTGGTLTTKKAPTVGASVTGAVIAAATIAQLGFTITEKLYDKYPDFFEDNYLQILAPQAWKEIAYSGTNFGNLIYTLFYKELPTVDSTGKWYVPEKAFAYMAKYAVDKGILNTGDPSYDIDDATGLSQVVIDNMPYANATIPLYIANTPSSPSAKTVIRREWDTDIPAVGVAYTGASVIIGGCLAYTEPFTVIETDYYYDGSTKETQRSIKSVKINGKTVYYYRPFSALSNTSGTATPSTIPYEVYRASTGDATGDVQVAYILLYGVKHGGESTEGISKQESATTPTITEGLTTDEWLTNLKDTYPELWQERIENDVLQEDGSVNTITYIPLPVPTGGVTAQPTTETAYQNVTTINPDDEDATDTEIATITQPTTGTSTNGVTNTVNPTKTENPTDEGKGDTPSVIIPTGTAEALWSVYNPTLEQVKSLGSYLWSANFIDSLLKMFNNPMEAVISLHKIFGTPPTSGTGNIKIGYLDTGVSDVNLVSEQYFTVDCGSIDLPEYFGSVLDYGGYTNISLYLPFIGIVNIDNADIMRSTITIKYQIDVFTGACLAQVNVLRDASGGVLYQYSGNCAVQYPLSMGSYMNVFTSTLQGAIFGGLGGGVGIAVGGALGALRSGGATYERSGNFSGNAGAMGIKKPYLIISRPQTQIADRFNELQGYPTNTYTLISNCKGFTKVTACHVDFIGNATQTEKTLIDRALKDGIIIS